jgi:hypothetical protein
LGICDGQIDIEFRELAVCGGEHQKNQYHQQNVNERDQIDLGFVSVTKSEVHGTIPNSA